MKKIVLALAGASVAITGLAATPAAAADFGRHNDRGRYEQVQNRNLQKGRFVQNNRFVTQNRFQNHRWNCGDRFDRRYASNYMVISNPTYYRLRPAPYGYHWVRSGNDAVLVALASEIIGALVANAF